MILISKETPKEQGGANRSFERGRTLEISGIWYKK